LLLCDENFVSTNVPQADVVRELDATLGILSATASYAAAFANCDCTTNAVS